MNSDVKLLPLPEKDDDLPRSGMWNGRGREGSDPCWLRESVEAYARACVEADRKGRQEEALVEARQIIYDFLQRGTMGRHYGNVMARATVWLEQTSAAQPRFHPGGVMPDPVMRNGETAAMLTRQEDNYTVELFTDAAGEFRWRVRAANGTLVGTAGEGYKNSSHRDAMADKLFPLLPKVRIEVPYGS